MEDGWRNDSRRRGGHFNRRAVLGEILLDGPLSRLEIAGRVGLNQASVSRIARGLLDEGLIRELPERRDKASSPGRREVPLEIDPQRGFVLGIDICQMFQTVLLADIGNRVVESAHLEIGAVEDTDLVVRQATRECQRLIGTLPDGRARLLGVLVAVTGRVEPETGEVLTAPYLGWGSYPLEARLAEALDLPVSVQSMAATVAQAEVLFGAASQRDNVLSLISELGISGALVLEGREIGGRRFTGGEIGLSAMNGEGGVPVALDDLASGRAILSRLYGEDMAPGRASVSAMARALLDAIERDGADDPEVAALMSTAGRELGRAIVRFAPLIPPDLVLVAGGLSKSRRYVAAVRDAVADGDATRGTEVVASGMTGAFGPEAGGVSPSCAMAIHEFLIKRPGFAAPPVEAQPYRRWA